MRSKTSVFPRVLDRSSATDAEAGHQSSKSAAPRRPRAPLAYNPSSDNNNGSAKVPGPSRAAPFPPDRPAQPATYSISAGVDILPSRAAPTPPAKPPQPPAKPQKPSTEPLDAGRLGPVAAARLPGGGRPPLPQKPGVG